MREKGLGSVYFSLARHFHVGFFTKDLIMYSHSLYALAKALDIWKKKFNSRIKMILDL